jgi:hypothetical protein
MKSATRFKLITIGGLASAALLVVAFWAGTGVLRSRGRAEATRIVRNLYWTLSQGSQALLVGDALEELRLAETHYGEVSEFAVTDVGCQVFGTPCYAVVEVRRRTNVTVEVVNLDGEHVSSIAIRKVHE